MNTRDEIIKYLQSHPYSCADELSTVLGKTRANIQHHLKILERENYINRVSVPPASKSRGRPKANYRLLPMNQSNNIVPLVEALMQVLIHEPDTERKNQLMEEVARQILKPAEKNAALAQRLNWIVKEMNHHGYRSRWEAHPGGPQVIFRYCPYLSLPAKFPELCQIDAILLKQNLEVSEVKQVAKIQFPTVPSCRFIIREK